MILFCCVILLLFRTAVLQQEGGCTVIKDESEARKCFNLTDDDIAPPLPINLTSQINGNFICNNTKPYYAFFCTLYGTDLIWLYNDQIVNTFQNGDAIGTIYRRTFPEPPEMPLHNLTTVLTQLDREVGEEFNISVPFCISTLPVQPFDDDDFEVIPFNVSCQTHCGGADGQTICQTQHFNVAAKPKQPTTLTQNASRIQGSVPRAVASIDWDSSSDNDTTVVSYNVTLVNTETLDKLYVLQHNSSFTEVVSDGSYNLSISAIDLCRQQSEAATLQFRVDAAGLTTPQPCSEEQLKSRVTGLAAAFTPLTVALIVVIVVLSACLVHQCRKHRIVGNNVDGIRYGRGRNNVREYGTNIYLKLTS